jgi:phosphoribosylanthranilate isomerase
MRVLLTRLKVSGITSAADAAMAVEAGADIIACVLNPASPRYVTLEQAWSVRRALSAGVMFVGIFVDAPLPVVQRIMAHCGMDRAQLFGRESRSVVDTLARGFKAVTVASQEEAEDAARTYLSKRSGAPPDLLLHLVQTVERDWRIAASAGANSEYILASAALTDAVSVAAAMDTALPWALDVWEAVESSPGRLDRSRLQDVASAVKSANAGSAAPA